MYNTFPGVHGYKIWESNDFWESNNFDYSRHLKHSQSFDEKPEKPKHKYQVNDSILDINSGRVGRIRELLTWPNYLVDSSMGSWVCSEAHIEPLQEEEPARYNPLSTKITDITTTGDITISKGDLANDGGESTISSIKRVDDDINDLRCLSDINMQKTTNIEEKTHDIEQQVHDIEKQQKKISKLSKLALLSRFL